MKLINFKAIEKKWQGKWGRAGVFKAKEGKGGKDKNKKFYALEMYPYPSGYGLHMGHALNYTIGDIFARFKRMQGFNVLYPMGFDSFGLPAENAAIKNRSHPKKFTDEAIKNYIKQMKGLGISYDWSRMLMSHDPAYYKWDQWIFLKMLERGLAYRKKAAVNFCRKCNTVLANEQVVDGKCWRHEDTEVEVKQLEQWFFKTTEYADELYHGLDKLDDWPEMIKTLQRNWIGRSEGTEVDFEVPWSKETNFVLLHGFTGSPKDNFFPWLKRELESRGHKVSVPELPNTRNPKIIEQVEYVLKNCKFDEDTVLLGHSLGSVVALKVAENLNKPIKKLILGAGFLKPDFEDHARPFAKSFDWKFDFDKIRKNVRDVLILRALNDSAVGGFHADKIKEAIGGNIITFKAEDDHICADKEPAVLDNCLQKWKVFTTRVDTLFGVTFLVVSAQHPEIMSLVTADRKKEVETFLKKVKSTKEEDIDKMNKEGVFTGSYAIHPLTGKKIPIWAGNFVVSDYGSGMVMGVPAHDARDFEFARKYGLSIQEVIRPVLGTPVDEAEFRKTISAVVHRKKDNKFLLLKWNNFGWIAPSIGGVEEGEDIIKAAEREVLEETGYKTKFIKSLGGAIESYFYAENKKVWRHRIDQPVLLELIDEKPLLVSKEEKGKHEVVWLSAEEALAQISHEGNKWGLLRYLGRDFAYTDYGVLINSNEFNGLSSAEGIEHIAIALQEKGLGRKKVAYRLRDWLVSRQRFWGTPIPVIYCDSCGAIPVREKDLPVKLPDNLKFTSVENPLKTHKAFVNVKCWKCSGKARRETDTMDTFVNSSWYFLRYLDNKNKKAIFDKKKADYWMPVDLYIGGKEHATLHLIYFRFYTKFLRDLGLLSVDEPAKRLFNQGMLHAEDGRKMSKSYGNIIVPEVISEKYGIDTARLFLVSAASPDKDINWNSDGIEGSLRFVLRMFEFFNNIRIGKSSKKIEHYVNSGIKEITREIEYMKYNLAVIKLRALFEVLEKENEVAKNDLESFVKLLAVFAPHIAEEFWAKIKGKGLVSVSKWPTANEEKIDMKIEEAEKVLEKTVEDIKQILKLVKEKQGKDGKKIYLYVLPHELKNYDNKTLSERTGLEVKVYAVNDAGKYDPSGKSGKVKPGRPGIYVE